MTTTVSENNQVSIPPEIARDLDIHPGTQLEWVKAQPGEIILRPLRSRAEQARELMGSGKKWVKTGTDPIAGLIQEREQDDPFIASP